VGGCLIIFGRSTIIKRIWIKSMQVPVHYLDDLLVARVIFYSTENYKKIECMEIIFV